MAPEAVSVQFTPLLLGSFATVAIKGCVPVPASTRAEAGDTVTPMPVDDVTVIVAVAVKLEG